jgi:anti-anti-sigma factor
MIAAMTQEPLPQPRLSIVMHEGVHVVVFPARTVLDAFEVKRIGHELRSCIEGLEKPKIVIDLGTVLEISSAALGMLVSARTSTDLQGGSACLANVQDRVFDVFRAGKFQKTLPIHDSVDAAIGSFRS